LKSKVAGKDVSRGGFQLVVQGIPILLDTIRGKNQVVTQDPNGNPRIVELKTKGRGPRGKRGSRRGERHIDRLVKIDSAVGSTTVIFQRDNKNATIRQSNTNAQVIRVGPRDVDPPREAQTPETLTKSHEQRFESQVEQERGERVALTNPTANRNRSNRMTIVQKESGGVCVGGGKGMLNKDREAKFVENGTKVRVRNPVVGFFLVEENQSTFHRGRARTSTTAWRSSSFGSVAQNVAESHCHISSIAITNKASLMRRDQVGKDIRKSRGEHAGEDLDVTVGEGDRSPISDVSVDSTRLWDQRHKGLRPRQRRRTTRQDSVEKGKKDRDKGFGERLIPFIRNAIRARGLTGRKCLNRGQQLVRGERGKKRIRLIFGKGRQGNGRKE